MTVECELKCSNGFDIISLTTNIFSAYKFAPSERVFLIYNPLKHGREKLLPGANCSVAFDSKFEECLLHIDKRDVSDTLVTSTPLVKEKTPIDRDDTPLLAPDISDIAVSTANENKTHELGSFGSLKEEYSIVDHGKIAEERSSTVSGVKLGVHSETMEVSTSKPTADYEKIEKPEAKIDSELEVKKALKSHSFSSKKDFVPKSKLDVKKRKSELEAELSNVRKMRQDFANRMFKEKRSIDSLQRQEKASELRLVRKMRENSLKEIQMEEKEKLKVDKRSEIAAELEDVRRIRKNFSGLAEDEFENYSLEGKTSILEANQLAGVEGDMLDSVIKSGAVSPLQKSSDIFQHCRDTLPPIATRTVTDDELDLVRGIRSKMRSEDEEDVVFEDSSMESADVEQSLVVENPLARTELDWVRYHRSHAEVSPQKLEASFANLEDRRLEEIRHIRKSCSPDELMAERRARAESEKQRLNELEKELANVRYMRQKTLCSIDLKGSNVSSGNDLEDVRELRRTKSLGSLPAFRGESTEYGQKSKTWVFGGVNILPHREVVINTGCHGDGKVNSFGPNQQNSENFKKQTERPSSSFESENKKANQQNLKGNQELKMAAVASDRQSPFREQEQRKEQIKRGYTIL